MVTYTENARRATVTGGPSAAVQEKLRELRQKEAATIAQQELLKQKLIEGIENEAKTKSVEWEAEILFEIEKKPGFIEWLRSKLQSPTSFDTAEKAVWRRPGVRSLPDGQIDCYSSLLTLEEIAENIIAEIPLPATYTLENERIRLRCRIITSIIDTVKESIKAEELASKRRLQEEALADQLKRQEEARIAAEEKAAAYEAWVRRRQAVLDRYADGIRSNMKTPYHSFTGIDPSNPFLIYVRYNPVSKILALENLRIDASDTKIEHQARIACPPTMKAPASWNDMFEKGRLPFLTCCPVCSDQVTLNGITGNGMVGGISCSTGWEHYRWEAVTNTHIKHNRPWDPHDPDGSKAARAARDKKIAETEAEIARLQMQLEALKKT